MDIAGLCVVFTEQEAYKCLRMSLYDTTSLEFIFLNGLPS